jgi:hypothetical protein
VVAAVAAEASFAHHRAVLCVNEAAPRRRRAAACRAGIERSGVISEEGEEGVKGGLDDAGKRMMAVKRGRRDLDITASAAASSLNAA